MWQQGSNTCVSRCRTEIQSFSFIFLTQNGAPLSVSQLGSKTDESALARPWQRSSYAALSSSQNDLLHLLKGEPQRGCGEEASMLHGRGDPALPDPGQVKNPGLPHTLGPRKSRHSPDTSSLSFTPGPKGTGRQEDLHQAPSMALPTRTKTH